MVLSYDQWHAWRANVSMVSMEILQTSVLMSNYMNINSSDANEYEQVNSKMNLISSLSKTSVTECISGITMNFSKLQLSATILKLDLTMVYISFIEVVFSSRQREKKNLCWTSVWKTEVPDLQIHVLSIWRRSMSCEIISWQNK